MNPLAWIPTLLFPFGIGYFLTTFFSSLPGGEASGCGRCLFRLSLAGGLGIGLVSALFFFWKILVFPSGQYFFWLETALLLATGALAVLYGRRGKTGDVAPAVSPSEWDGVSLCLLAALLVSLLAVAVMFYYFSAERPHGGWDAWGGWNLRARFMLRGGDRWTEMFGRLSKEMHPEYPLLTSAFIARGWGYVGGEDPALPAAVAAIFTFGTVGLLVDAVSFRKGKIQGVLAGLLLIAPPLYVLHGSSQYADVPFGFFVLVATVLAGRLARSGEDGLGTALLCGLVASFAAWTKNEGILFLAVLAAVLLAGVALRVAGSRFGARNVAYILVGALPVLAAVAYFKLALAPGTELLELQGKEQTLPRLLDLSRHLQILKAWAWDMSVGYFGPAGILYLLLSGVKAEGDERREAILPLSVLILMLSGYYLVYAASPFSLDWLLGTSSSRVLLQLWPLYLYLVFFLALPPVRAGRLERVPAPPGGEAAHRKKRKKGSLRH
jgi:hypothetical protein